MLRYLLLTALVLVAGCLSIVPDNEAASVARPRSSDAQERAEEVALSSILKSVQAPKTAKDNYKISPSDLLTITVFREDELNRSIRVNQDGEISFPLVGNIKVGGKSVIEAEQAISSALGDYLKHPQVTIFIKEYSARQVYVLGEVKTPGAYPLPTESGLTVLEAISLAGGFTAVAAQDRTRVIRTKPDGRSENLIIEVSVITKGGQKDKDLPLVPSDVVFVPQSFF